MGIVGEADERSTSTGKLRDSASVRGLGPPSPGCGATRCCAQLGLYIRFCETNPPILEAKSRGTYLCKNTYDVCRGDLQVGSFWETNPPGGDSGSKLGGNCSKNHVAACRAASVALSASSSVAFPLGIRYKTLTVH